MFETHGIGQTPSSRARHLLLVILVSVLISYKKYHWYRGPCT